MTRITLVLEYASDADVPRIGIDTKDFGNFTLHSLQFSDALLELEVLHEYIQPIDLMAARHDDRFPGNSRCSGGSMNGKTGL